jgi:hypothetical protein
MKKFTLVILAIVLIAGGLYVGFKKEAHVPVDITLPGKTDEKPGSDNFPQASEMIKVVSPKVGDSLDATNGFTVTGEAKGNWFFEATAPVTVFDKNGSVLAKTYVTAQGEWMTTNFVPFKGTISPFLTIGAREGYIEFENSNPSDNEGFRRSLRVNVTFPVQVTQKIKLYYGNTIKNPNAADCTKVFVVERTVPKASSIAGLALATMFGGPTDIEVTNGYVSALNQGNTILKSLSITNGVAKADFSLLPSGGSCLVGEARAQIEQTLKQFSTVKSVKILLNGSESEALQP